MDADTDERDKTFMPLATMHWVEA